MASFLEDIQCADSECHKIHETHDDVQPNCFVISDTKYTGDSNMISYDQFVKDNAKPVVRNNAYSVSNDAFMIIINEMPELTPRSVGYKIPIRLARDKQVHHALYNGHEIIKSQHAPVIVHNSEDTIDIAEITRKKINEMMKTPLWTHNKINIRPPDYSKENFLATFTPQTQLNPEQIFWSKDVFKMKTEALAEQDKAAKPVRALTMYPPNTPKKLVPRVLPTKSQVKINI
nr:hypothetical protein [Tanacetum cinerariifolium]